MKVLKLAPDRDFNGFVSLFNNKTKNVLNYISVSAFTYNGWGSPNTVLDHSIICLDSVCQWVSPNDLSKAYLSFSFKYPICLSHYSLRTITSQSSITNYPKTWTIESSLDNNNWVTIDSRTDRTELTGSNNSYTYGIDGSCSYSKYIKIKFLQTTASGIYHFHITRVDFFGAMNFENSHVPFRVGLETCLGQHKTLSTQILFIALICLS